MFTYPAFLYLLNDELLKSRRSSAPVSVVLIQARIGGGRFDYGSPLPASFLGHFVREISLLKRSVDVLAHYEVFDAALILPNTNKEGADLFANRLAEKLKTMSIGDEPGAQLYLAVGVATAKNEDIEELLGAAEHARNLAQNSKSGVCCAT